MTDEPKIHIDADWKAEAQADKEKFVRALAAQLSPADKVQA